MQAYRNASADEVNTLKDVLVKVLPETCQVELTATAVECAKAVKAAFEELYAESTQETTAHSPSAPA